MEQSEFLSLTGPTGCFSFILLDDPIIEGPEQFSVAIVGTGSAQILSPSITTITINDNDRE